jgi:hypothetical protein
VLQKIKHQTLNSNPTGQTLLSLAALTIIKNRQRRFFTHLCLLTTSGDVRRVFRFCGSNNVMVQ